MTDRAIRNHPHYTPDDHAYLKANGWKAREILERWDAERRAGKAPVRWDTEESLCKLWRTLARVDLD